MQCCVGSVGTRANAKAIGARVSRQPERRAPERHIPVGTIERIRVRAGSAIALFAASIFPAMVGAGLLNASTDKVNIATPFAFGFWALGMIFGIWAAVPTLRHWDDLPAQIRWFGALPLLSVSLLLAAAMIAALFL